jgi:hypothetical protein
VREKKWRLPRGGACALAAGGGLAAGDGELPLVEHVSSSTL